MRAGTTIRGTLRDYLRSDEVKALLARRDAILAHFTALVAAKGEAAVLY